MRHATHVDACLDDVCLAVHDFCLGTSSQQAAPLALSISLPWPGLRVGLDLARVPETLVSYFASFVRVFRIEGHFPEIPKCKLKRAKLFA